MDKQKIKRIIAREGLIILCIAVLTILFWVLTRGGDIEDTSALIPLIYPIYLLIRFIIWAVRTLKEGK